MKAKEQPLRDKRFSTIVNENAARFARIARLYAGDEAEDLIQEILMQIWRSLPSYNEQSALNTWCYRIALNTGISYRRALTREKRRKPGQSVSAELIASVPSSSDIPRLLERFLESLSEIDRAVLLMYLDDLTNEEIAESIGVTNEAIRTRMSRIRDQLKSWEASNGEL